MVIFSELNQSLRCQKLHYVLNGKALYVLSEDLPNYILIYSSLVNSNFALFHSDNCVEGIIARLTYGKYLDLVYNTF